MPGAAASDTYHCYQIARSRCKRHFWEQKAAKQELQKLFRLEIKKHLIALAQLPLGASGGREKEKEVPRSAIN